MQSAGLGGQSRPGRQKKLGMADDAHPDTPCPRLLVVIRAVWKRISGTVALLLGHRFAGSMAKNLAESTWEVLEMYAAVVALESWCWHVVPDKIG